MLGTLSQRRVLRAGRLVPGDLCLGLGAFREFFPGMAPMGLAKLASSSPISKDAPFFFPLAMGTPEAFSGQAEQALLASSVFEGLSFSVRDLLENQLHVCPRVLAASGGGSRSDYWLQQIGDITGIPVERCAANSVPSLAQPSRWRPGTHWRAHVPKFSNRIRPYSLLVLNVTNDG